MFTNIKINKKYFHKLNLEKIETPCFVIDKEVVRQNLKILSGIKEKSDIKILLALKAFSMKEFGELFSCYIDGTASSGLNEAKLAKKHFHGIISTYSPAFKKSEIKEVLSISDQVIFNSEMQYNDFLNLTRSFKKEIGIRINPIYSEIKTKKYNPAGYQSRLGLHIKNLKNIDFKNVDGLHFHSLCEQNFSSLKNTWDKILPHINKYLNNIKWINMGGGHHLTRDDYDLKELIRFLNSLKNKFNFQIYLEPGEAIVFQSGILIGQILDVIKSHDKRSPNICITDLSATCHMPDVLEAPYRPKMLNEAKNGIEFLIGGPSCLASDNIGKYKFKSTPQVGDKIVFLDQAHYTLVKTNYFNGVKHPSVAIWDSLTNEFEIIRRYSFRDYEKRI